MKSLCLTLYFSGMAIPSTPQEPATSGAASWDCARLKAGSAASSLHVVGSLSLRPAIRPLWASGCRRCLFGAATGSWFAPLHVPPGRGHKWAGVGEGSCRKEECGPATPRLASPPANRPRRLFLRAGMAQGRNSRYNYISAFPTAGGLRN